MKAKVLSENRGEGGKIGEAADGCTSLASNRNEQPVRRVPTLAVAHSTPTQPVRIQRRRAKGWRMPTNTVCVDRSTHWGNPFPITPRTPRREAVFAHKALCHGYFCLTQGISTEVQTAYNRFLNEHLEELRGKNLACFCRLDQECHADILLELANQRRSRRLIKTSEAVR